MARMSCYKSAYMSALCALALGAVPMSDAKAEAGSNASALADSDLSKSDGPIDLLPSERVSSQSSRNSSEDRPQIRALRVWASDSVVSDEEDGDSQQASNSGQKSDGRASVANSQSAEGRSGDNRYRRASAYRETGNEQGYDMSAWRNYIQSQYQAPTQSDTQSQVNYARPYRKAQPLAPIREIERSDRSSRDRANAANSTQWREVKWLENSENFVQARYKQAANKFVRDWGNLPKTKVKISRGRLKEGASGPDVALLRNRLGLSHGVVFDRQLGDKIELYRAAHGLPEGRDADRVLIDSLNWGYDAYRDVIKANLERMNALPINLGEKFLMVDAAGQMLYFFEGKEAVNNMRVVVGTQDNQTPFLTSRIDHIVLNPYWNVPADLVRDRYADRVLEGGREYLTTRRFDVLSDFSEKARLLSYDEVDWKAVKRGDVNLRLRQQPGPGNGMGDIKFMFPNEYGVYLHDTPSKNLFKSDVRLFSAGCVRVERPWELANWLFGYRPSTKSKEPEQKVYLPEPVPVYLLYMTAKPNGVGFDFSEDLYKRDSDNPRFVHGAERSPEV